MPIVLQSGDPGSAGSIPVNQAVFALQCSGGDSGGVGGVPALCLHSNRDVLCGDPRSVGGIPHSGDPTGAGGIPVTVPFAPTAGLILDSTTAPIGGVTILILSFDGSVIAAATTNELGAFALNLPKVPGLTLVVPALDVYDVPVIAGDPLLVIVP